MPDNTPVGMPSALKHLSRAIGATNRVDIDGDDPIGAAEVNALTSIAASLRDLVDQGDAALKQSRRAHKVMKEGWRQNREAAQRAREDQLKVLAVLRENNDKLLQIEQALAEQKARPIPVIGEATIGACGCSVSLPEATDDAPRVAIPEPPKVPEWLALVNDAVTNLSDPTSQDNALLQLISLVYRLQRQLEPGSATRQILASIAALGRLMADSALFPPDNFDFLAEDGTTPFSVPWLLTGVFDFAGEYTSVDWLVVRDSASAWLAHLTGELR